MVLQKTLNMIGKLVVYVLKRIRMVAKKYPRLVLLITGVIIYKRRFKKPSELIKTITNLQK